MGEVPTCSTRGCPKGKRRFVTPAEPNVHGDALCLGVRTWARHITTGTVLNSGWRLAVGHWWRLAVGGWRLAVGDWWQLAIGGWRLVAVDGWRLAIGGSWRLAVGDWWQLAVGSWRLVAIGGWRLAVVDGQRLAVGGPWGLAFRAVLNKTQFGFLRTALVQQRVPPPPPPAHSTKAGSQPPIQRT